MSFKGQQARYVIKAPKDGKQYVLTSPDGSANRWSNRFYGVKGGYKPLGFLLDTADYTYYMGQLDEDAVIGVSSRYSSGDSTFIIREAKSEEIPESIVMSCADKSESITVTMDGNLRYKSVLLSFPENTCITGLSVEYDNGNIGYSNFYFIDSNGSGSYGEDYFQNLSNRFTYPEYAALRIRNNSSVPLSVTFTFSYR